jgi:hypothetical protein
LDVVICDILCAACLLLLGSAGDVSLAWAVSTSGSSRAVIA